MPLSAAPPEEQFDEAITDEVQRLVQERRAGRLISPSELDPLNWELLLVWDEAEAIQGRAHQARVEALFHALLQMRT